MGSGHRQILNDEQSEEQSLFIKNAFFPCSIYICPSSISLIFSFCLHFCLKFYIYFIYPFVNPFFLLDTFLSMLSCENFIFNICDKVCRDMLFYIYFYIILYYFYMYFYIMYYFLNELKLFLFVFFSL